MHFAESYPKFRHRHATDSPSQSPLLLQSCEISARERGVISALPSSSFPFSSPSSISIHPPSPTWTTRSALPPAQKTFCVAGAKLNFSRLPSPHPNQPANPPERRAPTDRQPSTRRRDRQQHVIVSGMENSLMGIRLAVQGSPFALGRKDTPFHMLLEKCLWILDAVYYCSCGSNGPPCA